MSRYLALRYYVRPLFYGGRAGHVVPIHWLLVCCCRASESLAKANTLVKAGATGTGVADAEIDLLRVHLDTARYQLLSQYPDADATLMLNCMLLAATEGIASGDGLSR